MNYKKKLIYFFLLIINISLYAQYQHIDYLGVPSDVALSCDISKSPTPNNREMGYYKNEDSNKYIVVNYSTDHYLASLIMFNSIDSNSILYEYFPDIGKLNDSNFCTVHDSVFYSKNGFTIGSIIDSMISIYGESFKEKDKNSWHIVSRPPTKYPDGTYDYSNSVFDHKLKISGTPTLTLFYIVNEIP